MKEYIERVTALNALIRALGYCQCANDVITRIPAADVAEVRHGRWVRDKWPSGTHKLICSECGEWSGKKSRYCPSCGALMKGDEHEAG